MNLLAYLVCFVTFYRSSLNSHCIYLSMRLTFTQDKNFCSSTSISETEFQMYWNKCCTLFRQWLGSNSFIFESCLRACSRLCFGYMEGTKMSKHVQKEKYLRDETETPPQISFLSLQFFFTARCSLNQCSSWFSVLWICFRLKSEF